MNWKSIKDSVFSGMKTFYNKLEFVAVKSFRGLLMEKKEGGWEFSKGNVAFWIVLAHCMYVWSGNANVDKVSKMVDEAAEKVDGNLLDTVTGSIGLGGGVPEQEFWFLMFLLGYATVKHTKGGLTNALSAVRGNR